MKMVKRLCAAAVLTACLVGPLTANASISDPYRTVFFMPPSLPPSPAPPGGVVWIHPIVGIEMSTLPWPFSKLFCVWPACGAPRSR
jgi:hypothetical protein